MVVITTPAATGGSVSANPARALSGRTQDQAELRQLLLLQMQTQDLLHPGGELDCLQQLMTPANLAEQFQALQDDIARLCQEQQLSQANSLLGRTVEIEVHPGTRLVGTVTAVQRENGTPRLVVGGQPYDLSQVRNITPTPGR
jgi:flagellar hook assembly protein FlgD